MATDSEFSGFIVPKFVARDMSEVSGLLPEFIPIPRFRCPSEHFLSGSRREYTKDCCLPTMNVVEVVTSLQHTSGEEKG